MLQRWNRHVASSNRTKTKGRSFFASAIRKYGKDAFTHEVLETCTSLEVANEREIYFIAKLDTCNPNYGFNLMRGGAVRDGVGFSKNPWDDLGYQARGVAAAKARWQSPIYRAKILSYQKARWTPELRATQSVLSKEILSRPDVMKKCRAAGVGKFPSPEVRAKLSAASSSRSHGFTLEAKAKISASLKGRKPSKASIDAIKKKHEERISNPTCRHHGPLADSDYRLGRNKSGSLSVLCKICIRMRRGTLTAAAIPRAEARRR